MASSSKKKEERKITKQFILDHLDENEVDLSMCDLCKVPVKELAMVPRGTRLDLSNNHLETLTESFISLKHLVHLDLSKNQLKELPHNFGQLPNLQRLDLYSNKLAILPVDFWQLKKLRWLDLKNNPLEEDLAKAAGTCVNDVELKQCAKNVLVYMKHLSSELERKRQRELEEKKERERKQAELDKKAQEEARRQKSELRKRRKEEQSQLRKEQQEKADRLAGEQQADQQGDASDSDQEHKPLKQQKSRDGCGCCSIIGFTIAILFVLLLIAMGGVMLCHHVYDKTACRHLREYIVDQMSHLLDVLGIQLE